MDSAVFVRFLVWKDLDRPKMTTLTCVGDVRCKSIHNIDLKLSVYSTFSITWSVVHIDLHHKYVSIFDKKELQCDGQDIDKDLIFFAEI
ncbi:hypothetical protein RCL_jg2736.t1 [Rhizophagus clarus]|uniref:Uncharacterized protein n=1 Tax=Rhizophagus clarus TaxID=94130 RepID=A0A8H3R1W7_9GLOM|nr:hypothetical protein RCL_jg2736.t1 [Rhizophagus clarus]